jgi:phage gp46-like protein
MAFSPAFAAPFARGPAPALREASPGPARAADIRTFYVDLEHGIDWSLSDGDLATDEGLTTAVLISLFTDARAREDDALPPGVTDRRGWWGDAWPVAPGDRIGSRLWLLAASKQLQEALIRAREFGEEALAWLVRDGAARRVEVETFIARFELMGMSVRIHRPDGSTVPVRFEMLWRSL